MVGSTVWYRRFGISAPALPVSLSPGAALNITMAITPNVLGAVSGTLVIQSNDPRSWEIITVQGDGQSLVAQLQPTPTSVNFGNEVVPIAISKSVTLSNTGNIVVTVSGVSVCGSGFGYSGLTPESTLSP
jgi:hypothetical protein